MINKLYHINGGTMQPCGLKIFNRSLTEFSCHCLLIETADGLILVDTGIGMADIFDPPRMGPLRFLVNVRMDPDNTAIRQIEKLGYTPDDVKHIILTHMDIEHSGGLADFPEAQVHVHEYEYQAAMKPVTVTEHIRYSKVHFAHHPSWVTYKGTSSEPWFGFDCIRELEGIPSGIILIPLPGHTRGHCGVAIETKNGWFLYAGDAYHFENLVVDYSACSRRIKFLEFFLHEKSKTALKQIEKISMLVAGSGNVVRVCSTHGSTEFKQIAVMKLH